MDLRLTQNSESCEVFHKFQLAGANAPWLLAISGQGLPNSQKYQRFKDLETKIHKMSTGKNKSRKKYVDTFSITIW